MRNQSIFLLGSTGSIGTQTLDVVRINPEKLTVFGVTGNKNWELLAKQVNEFKPKVAVLADKASEKQFRNAVRHEQTQLYFGHEYIAALVAEPEIDVVLNSLVGFSGFIPTCKALESGKRVALANKESLVVGGELIKEHLGLAEIKVFPVDSEHSAILQCLVGEPLKSIEKLIITASGGPFRDYSLEGLEQVTVEKALKHPNWSMGAKITIDSATMMNKGFEVIEACWLFDLPLESVEAVIHPQSIIHSMVVFEDGSAKAQLGIPDMRLPIQYALSYPDRWPGDVPRISWSEAHTWTFRPVDTQLYACYGLALQAYKDGGYAPAVLNASNEIAVARFLNKEIPYIAISKIVEKSLEQINETSTLSVDSIIEVDKYSREFAQTLTI
ncbi:MAG: 1-deoxy-D-xylulose-5-phosphate reductoisomerase [Balneolales bacterium]|nr:1-deoxy-D-xylulose-5-phosphate reductoisomerase [Balneolales bacterium]